MSKVSRGGLTLKTSKIGKLNCLRQQLLMPGEKMNIGINGTIRLESLRERDVMRINAHMATFMTPLRWLVTNWTDYVKQGPNTAETLETRANNDWSKLGLGAELLGGENTYLAAFEDNVLRCFNEWYKWPEDADATRTDLWAVGNEDGLSCVPLSAAWTRCRYSASPEDANDDEIDVSGATMAVQDLAETQARFRGAMKRDVLSFGRWMELVKEVWRGDPSREVDQVPIMLDQVEVGVNPREIPATDGASLGQWQSLFDFNVNHNINGVVAPEHCIVSTFLVIRFAPVLEQAHPLARTHLLDWFEVTGDPEYLAAAQPVQVQRRDIFDTTSTTELGYLPAGWQWRCNHDVIGRRIDGRDSFPYMLQPGTKEACKDATRVKDAFRSQALGDYLVDIYFSENGYQPIGDAMESYFSGMMDDVTPGTGGRNQEFPKGGKNL